MVKTQLQMMSLQLEKCKVFEKVWGSNVKTMLQIKKYNNHLCKKF